jgi:hypothetical protein
MGIVGVRAQRVLNYVLPHTKSFQRLTRLISNKIEAVNQS